MNIRYLQETLSRIEEIRVIGKTAMVDGTICNIMGMVRNGTKLRLIILEYNESFHQNDEERKMAGLNGTKCMPESNRMLLRSNKMIDAAYLFCPVSELSIGEKEFRVYSSEHRTLSTRDWEYISVICRFLDNGWQPDGIDHQSIDRLFASSLELDGSYASIPDFNGDEGLRFVLGPRSIAHLVEKPVDLVVGGKYPDKLVFQDAITGTEHWVQINRVYLSDMREEMEKVFSSPKLQEQMTPEKFAGARLDFEKHFSKICPRGMLLPVIEYECEEGISLQFFTKSYLDAEPCLNNSGSAGFIIQPDQPEGILGLKLKAAVLHEPVPEGTVRIEAELFQYFEMLDKRTVVVP